MVLFRGGSKQRYRAEAIMPTSDSLFDIVCAFHQTSRLIHRQSQPEGWSAQEVRKGGTGRTN